MIYDPLSVLDHYSYEYIMNNVGMVDRDVRLNPVDVYREANIPADKRGYDGMIR